MIDNELIEQVKQRVSDKFDYLQSCEIDTLLDMAISDYIAVRYPSENGRPSKNDLHYDFFNTQWIYKRIIDILERAGASNVVSYRENGLSYTYASSYIDDNLIKQIMPRVGVPK